MKLTPQKTLLAIAIGGIPMAASALSLEDYTVANSIYDEAFISGSATINEPEGNNANEQIGFNYNLLADYEKTFSTLPRSWGFALSLDATGSRSDQETSTIPVTTTDDAGLETTTFATVDNETANDWGVTAEGVIDNYFHQTAYPKTFWFGLGRYESRESREDDDISATVGLGYGRVYNATPLAIVIRIVEELNEQGLLTGPIPDSIALEAAEIVDREDEFKSKFGEDEYRPDFYAAIEEALARSGAIRDGKLGALGAITMDDVLEDEPISTRRHGWVVRAGAGFQASDLSGLSDNDPKILLEWEYAKPFGYKGQFINVLSYEPVFGDNTIQVINNLMTYSYEVTDTIDWNNSWRLGYSDNDIDETISHVINSRYSFDLGNQLDYFVGVNLTQTDTDPNPADSDGDGPAITVSSGFSYRLK